MNEVRVYTNKCLIAKGNQMGIVVPQIPADWIWLRIRKADMKKGVEEEVPGEVPIPAPLPALPSLPPETMEAYPEEEDTVLVEIGGEILEMTRIQARQILAQGV
jgi:hypothetical protein